MEEPWVVENLVPEFRAAPLIGVPVPLAPLRRVLFYAMNDPKKRFCTRAEQKAIYMACASFATAMVGRAEQQKWGFNNA
jgi:hypothetical protein